MHFQRTSCMQGVDELLLQLVPMTLSYSRVPFIDASNTHGGWDIVGAKHASTSTTANRCSHIWCQGCRVMLCCLIAALH